MCSITTAYGFAALILVWSSVIYSLLCWLKWNYVPLNMPIQSLWGRLPNSGHFSDNLWWSPWCSCSHAFAFTDHVCHSVPCLEDLYFFLVLRSLHLLCCLHISPLQVHMNWTCESSHTCQFHEWQVSISLGRVWAFSVCVGWLSI